MFEIKFEYLSASDAAVPDSGVDVILLYRASRRDDSDRETMSITIYPVSKYGPRGRRTDLSDKLVNEYNVFDLTLDHKKKAAKFFDWDIVLPHEVRNYKIGSYVTSKLISWGQNKAGDYSVQSLKLALEDARDDKSRDIRNGFYSGLDFILEFHDGEEKRVGQAKASSLFQLTPRDIPTSIKKSSLRQTIYQLQSCLHSEGLRLKALQENISNTQNRNRELIGENISLKRSNLLWKILSILMLLVIIYILLNR